MLFTNKQLFNSVAHPTVPRLICFQVSKQLATGQKKRELSWKRFVDELRHNLTARSHGMVMINFVNTDHSRRSDSDLKAFCTRLSQDLGKVLPETRNTDGRSMAATDSIQISLKSESAPSRSLRHFADPSLAWPLHTDRALQKNPGDFLMVCKLLERGGRGGEIRLLHLDDWPDFEKFSNHSKASSPIRWRGDPQMAPEWLQTKLRDEPGVIAPLFEEHPWYGTTIRFTDERFRIPGTLEQHKYLSSLTSNLAEIANNIPSFELPVGGMYIVNNRFVLHGRKAFQESGHFQRTLLRICGNLESNKE